jgi:transposase
MRNLKMSVTLRSPPKSHFGVGIDTARYGHRVTFLREDRQPAAPPLNITETRQGYDKLSQHLAQLHLKHANALFHVHIDAAGQYATNLERFLRSLDLPLEISIGEPKRNKDYHKAFFPKRTSDATESQAMARFGVVEKPPQTPATPNDFYVLREIAGRLHGQSKDTTRATNRLHNLIARVFPELPMLVSDIAAMWVLTLLRQYPTPQRIAKARLEKLRKIPYIKAAKAQEIQAAAKCTVGSLQGEITESLVIQFVEHLQQCLAAQKKLEKLLVQAYDALPPSGHVHVVSIPGIGTATAAVLVAKMISIDRFETPENLVGYFGIFPEENTSGVDRQGKPIPPGTMRMSAKGADLVRGYLWNAAKSAIECNPAVRDLYDRLRAKGTAGDVALGHCMRKLLHQVFGVWASDQPFDANYGSSSHESAPGALAQKESEGSENKTAAGHKRENPQSKVVTAANSTVQPAKPAIKRPRTQRCGASIDYPYLRSQINMERILSHLGHFARLRGSGSERRGPCPLHADHRPRSRDFSVNLDKNVYQCFDPECRSKGNVLDFWKSFQKLSLHQAAKHMADTFHLSIQPEQTEKTEPVVLATRKRKSYSKSR